MSSSVLRKTVKKLTDEQISFLCEEFGCKKDILFDMTEEELDYIYDTLCDLEVEELCKSGDGSLSERAEFVSEIVTVFGNEIAKEQGDYDEEDFEEYLND